MREKPTGYDSMSILLQKFRIAMGLTTYRPRLGLRRIRMAAAPLRENLGGDFELGVDLEHVCEPSSATRPTFNARFEESLYRLQLDLAGNRIWCGSSADYPPPAPRRRYLPPVAVLAGENSCGGAGVGCGAVPSMAR